MLQILFNGLASGLEIALIGLAFLFCYQSMRVINIALAAIISTSPYLFVAVYSLSLSLWLAGLICIAAGGLLAILSLFNYVTLRRRGASEMIQMVSSFALMIIILETSALVFDTRPRVLPDIGANFLLSGIHVLPSQVLTGIIAAVVFVALGATLRTRTGLAMRSLWQDARTLLVYGHDPLRITVFLFGAAGAIAACIGLLIGLDRPVTLDHGLWVLILGIVAAYLGGLGTLHGVLIGGAILGVTRSVSELILPASWVDVATYFILAIVVAFNASGIIARTDRVESSA